MLYGRLVTGSECRAVLQSAGISPETVVGDFYSYNFNGTLYWILQREYSFPPSEWSPDGWHLVYAPSSEEIKGGAPDPGFWSNIEAAIAALAKGAKESSETLAKLVPVLLLGLGGILLFAVYSRSKS